LQFDDDQKIEICFEDKIIPGYRIACCAGTVPDFRLGRGGEIIWNEATFCFEGLSPQRNPPILFIQKDCMKKFLYLSILATTVLLLSCSKSQSPDFDVDVDVQASFDQDRVQVFMDGRELLDKTLQTNYLLSLCTDGGQIKTTESEGRHTIKVIVNGTVKQEESFDLKNRLYIGVNFDKEAAKARFIFSDKPFGYD
jgi:hypothetical protein